MSPDFAITYRFLYDGPQPVQRETRHADWSPPGRVFTRTLENTTRLLRTIPGGPVVYADGDGTVDVQMTDRRGLPWYMYRAREGRHFNAACRGSGLLRPSPFPRGSYFEYAPWYLRTMETDFLLGRRGFTGWDGRPYDIGTVVGWPPAPTWWEKALLIYDDLPYLVKWAIWTAAAAGVAYLTVVSLGTIVPLATYFAVAGAVAVGAGLAAHYWGEYSMEYPAGFGALPEGVGQGFSSVGGAVAKAGGIVLAAPWFKMLPGVIGYPLMAGALAHEGYAAYQWNWSEKPWHESVERFGAFPIAAAIMMGPLAARVAAYAGRPAYAWASPQAYRVYLGLQRAAVEFYLRSKVGPGWRIHGDLVPRLRLWYSHPSRLHLRLVSGKVYHSGPVNIMQLTARPNKDWTGLSVYTEIGSIPGSGKYAAEIDVAKLSTLKAVYDLEPARHAVLGDLPAEVIAQWAAGRPMEAHHSLTMELFNIARQVAR